MHALDIRLTILYKLIFTNNKSFQLLYIVLFQWTVLKWSGDLDFYMPIYPLFSQSESPLEKVERFLWADGQQITEIWIWDQRKTIITLPGYTEPWAFFMDTWWDYSISSIKRASISYRIMIDQLTSSMSRQSQCWVAQWNGWFIIGDSGTDKYKKTRALIHNPWLRLCSTLTGNTQILH